MHTDEHIYEILSRAHAELVAFRASPGTPWGEFVFSKYSCGRVPYANPEVISEYRELCVLLNRSEKRALLDLCNL